MQNILFELLKNILMRDKNIYEGVAGRCIEEMQPAVSQDK